MRRSEEGMRTFAGSTVVRHANCACATAAGSQARDVTTDVFEHEGENKLVYTTVFQQFQKRTEEAIDVGLRARLPWFDMEAFLGMMASRADELHSDVFDVLMTLADFEEFKELMLSFKDQAAFERGEGSAPLAPTIAPLTTSLTPPHSPVVSPAKTGHK